MSKSKRVPAGFHTVTPHLEVRGAAKAIEFYKKAFGATEEARLPGPDGKSIMHAMIRINGDAVMLVDEMPQWGALGPKALALAARRSAGAHPYLVTPEYTTVTRERLGPEALLAPEQKVILDTDRTEARRLARAHLALYLTLPNYLRNLRKHGFTEQDVAAPGSDMVVISNADGASPKFFGSQFRT